MASCASVFSKTCAARTFALAWLLISQGDYCLICLYFVSDPSKTLMFLEGCSSQHLGCTVLLRGSTNSELAKLKRVVSRLVFTQFSWRLENSFLMDEFALPPSPPTDSFLEEPATSDSSQHDSAIVLSNRELLHGSCEVGAEEPQVHRMNDGNVTSGTCDVAAAGESAQQGDMRSFSRSSSVQFNENVQSDNSSISSRKQCICCDKAEHVSPSCADCNNIMSSGSRKQTVVRESRNSSAGEGHVCEPLRELTQAEEAQTNCDSGKTQATHSGSKEKSLSEEKRTNVESVSDFSDPLHLYLNLDDEVFSTGSGQLSVAELPLTNRFRKALDDTILCSSPYLQVMLLS